jgi:Asp-tRNA(Asn)/Glu-tRNA(Gln) amidotransferase A subunit family amidase
MRQLLILLDMPTQFNSPAYKDDFPKVDAASIKYLRSAGALLMGMHIAVC